jgi:SLT domain-containing protein
MATTVGELRANLVLDSSNYTRGLAAARGEALGFGKTLGAVFGAISLTRVVNDFENLGSAIANFAIESTASYVKAQQMNQALTLLGQQAGISNTTIQDQIKRMVNLGATFETARNSMAEFLQAGLDATQVWKVYARAEDIAVTTGQTGNQVMQAIVDGVQQQNVEILRNAHIYIDGTKALQDYANALGTTVAQLTPAQRQQAYLNAIMQSTNNIAGIAQKQTHGLVYNWQQLRDTWKNTSEILGGILEPVISRVGKALQDMLDTFNASAVGGGGVANAINGWRDALNDLMDAMAPMAGAAEKLVVSFVKGFVGGLDTTKLDSIKTLGPAFLDLSKNAALLFENLGPAAAALGDFLAKVASQAVQDLSTILVPAIKQLADSSKVLATSLGDLNAALDKVDPRLSGFIKNIAVWQTAGGLVALFPPVTFLITVFGLIGVGLTVAAGAIKQVTFEVTTGAPFLKSWLTTLGGIPVAIAEFFAGLPGQIGGIMSVIGATINGIWTQIWQTLSGILGGIAGTITGWWNAIWQTIGGIGSGIFTTIATNWNNIWLTVANVANGIWSTLNTTWSNIWGTLTYWANTIWTDLTTTFYSLRDTLAHIFDDIYNWITQRLNWVLGKVNGFLGLVNTGLSPFGVSIPIGPFGPLARGGIVDGPTYALVGEAGRESVIPWSSKYRNRAEELWKQTGFALGMFRKMGLGGQYIRATYLPTGRPGQGGGGVNVSGIVSDAVTQTLGDLADAGTAMWAQLARGTLKLFADALPSWIQSQFGKLLNPVGEFLGGLFTGSGSVAQWIARAIQITGVGADWAAPLAILIQNESGGNPNAINNWDINAQRGDPSRGLMQTIGATFAAYALPGLGGIFDPIANIVAGIRYILARYGSIWNLPGIISVMGGGGWIGYRNGGMLPPGFGPLNETGQNEYVLNHPTYQRLLSALGRVEGALTGGRGPLNLSVTNQYAGRGVTAEEVVSDLVIALKTL